MFVKVFKYGIEGQPQELFRDIVEVVVKLVVLAGRSLKNLVTSRLRMVEPM